MPTEIHVPRMAASTVSGTISHEIDPHQPKGPLTECGFGGDTIQIGEQDGRDCHGCNNTNGGIGIFDD